MQEVSGEESLCPEKAIVLGPCRVIPKEFPNLTCRSIDVVLPKSGIRPESRLIEQLLAEVTAQSSDQVVAYRGSHRWAQAFEPVRLDGGARRGRRLREKGVYLITGGLGGIGLTIAEDLARAEKARLILIGRSTLPAREEWGRWLETHDEQDGVGRKIRKVQALEELGAEVLVIGADVACEEQMRAAVADAVGRFGEINGVVHAAGVPGGGIIQLKTPEAAAGVLTPKVVGTIVLDRVFRDAPLDFLLLCSSLNSIAGMLGQVDYCAANAFLDAFAHRDAVRNRRFTVSVNWDTWREVGMAANAEVPAEFKERKEEILRQGISPEEGVRVFRRIIDGALPQVVVSTRNFEALVKQHDALTAPRPAEEPGEPHTSNAAHERPQMSNAYVAPGNDLERSVAGIWQELLGIESVGIHDNFFELGGHSLLATQVISRVRNAFQVEPPLHILFENPTVSALAAAIAGLQQGNEKSQELDRLLKEIEGLSGDKVQTVLSQEMQLKL
nr:short-chain dehydrogenase/reductase SDR [uncultured bacterium]